jgi:murein DD-endopeptidase MepM/ murein hydrolase activator NlpD
VRKVLIAMLAGGLMAVAVPVQAAPAPAPATATPAPAPAAPLDPLAAQLQEQAALNATITSLDNELQSARDSQASLRVLVTANQAAIAQTLTQLSAAEQTYSDASARAATEKAAAATARHNARIDKELLGLYLRLGYETHDSLLAYLLSSDSVSELLSRAGDVAHLVHRSTDLVNQITADVTAAESAEAAAARDAATAQQAAAQLQLQQQTLQQQTQHAKDLIAQLGSQAAATTAEINAANGQSLAVAQQIAATRIAELDQTIAEAELAAWQAAEYYIQNHLGTLPLGIGTPPTVPVTGDGSQLVWPAHGVAISQGFGPSPYPFEPSFGPYPHFHTGIDLAGALGTPILSAADGVVVAADSSTVGYGNHVIVAHAGGLLTLYGHLSAMLVHPGDVVKAGQVIGLLGSSGNSTGPHCHFEVRANNQPVDPSPFLPALAPGATGP